MDAISIKIKKDDVLAVDKIKAAYIGAKMPEDDESYSRFAILEEDKAALDNDYKSAVRDLVISAAGYSPSVTTDGIKLEDVPSNFDTGVVSEMEGVCQEYVMWAVLSRWFCMCGNTDLVERANMQLHDKMVDYQLLLRRRLYPRRN